MKIKLYIISLILLLPVSIVRADTFSIVAFGDSITAGLKRDAAGNVWGITSPPQGARIGSYAPPLEAKFIQETEHVAYVYNWGYHGELTQEGVNRINSVLFSNNAQFILLMEGANDIIHNVSPATVKFNMGIMIDRARAYGVTPVLGTITPQGSNAEYWNTQLVALAAEKNVLLADQFGALNSNFWLYNSGDGLHINSTGDNKMAETWLATLKKDKRIGTNAELNMAPIIQFLLN